MSAPLTPSPVHTRSKSMLAIVVGTSEAFRQAARSAASMMAEGSRRVIIGDPDAQSCEKPFFSASQAELVERSRYYLDKHVGPLELMLVFADSLSAIPSALKECLPDLMADIVADDVLNSLLFIDASKEEEDPFTFDAMLASTIAAVPPGVRAEASLYHCRVYAPAPDAIINFARPYARRILPGDHGVLTADMVMALTDLVEARLVKAVGSGRLSNSARTTSLATALSGFLGARAKAAWGLHSYTGSVVSTLIADLERIANQAGNPVIRAPSEHGLACAAMGRWILDDAPFLIVVTSGMADEFKGTLANLKAARAEGFIVCADTSAGYWFPFQGVIHREDNCLDVLGSRGFETIYLDRPERLAQDLEKAFECWFSRGTEPVFPPRSEPPLSMVF